MKLLKQIYSICDTWPAHNKYVCIKMSIKLLCSVILLVCFDYVIMSFMIGKLAKRERLWKRGPAYTCITWWGIIHGNYVNPARHAGGDWGLGLFNEKFEYGNSNMYPQATLYLPYQLWYQRLPCRFDIGVYIWDNLNDLGN